MKTAIGAVSIVALLGLGCGPGELIEADFDPSAPFLEYETFQFAPPERITPPPVALKTDTSGQVDELIEKATERELARKGIVRLEHGPPDLIVACLLVTKDGTAVDSERYRYGGTRWQSDRRFDKGTLVIDLVSNHTRAIVWRGIALRIGVNGTLTGKQIDIVVSQILALYPPGE